MVRFCSALKAPIQGPRALRTLRWIQDFLVRILDVHAVDTDRAAVGIAHDSGQFLAMPGVSRPSRTLSMKSARSRSALVKP